MPKKVAAIVTEYRKWSHADVILRNLLDGYPDGKKPDLELVSLYTDQVPKSDMSRDLAKKHGFKIFDTIARGLTLGGKTLAVDGVLSIGEHGNYPDNEKGQMLYPRRRFFEEICKVFEQTKSRCRCSTTSTSRRRGTTRSGCTTARGSCSSRSWPARRSR